MPPPAHHLVPVLCKRAKQRVRQLLIAAGWEVRPPALLCAQLGRVGVLALAGQDPLSRAHDVARVLVCDFQDSCAGIFDGEDDGALKGSAAGGCVGHHGAEVGQCVEGGEEGWGDGGGVGRGGGGKSQGGLGG